ncbi:hypothetical protein DI272_43980 [Streptomyces sp. Act143]|nr:hypothetical protein DI272_43980 [Streptomyces sp. Act143]
MTGRPPRRGRAGRRRRVPPGPRRPAPRRPPHLPRAGRRRSGADAARRGRHARRDAARHRPQGRGRGGAAGSRRTPSGPPVSRSPTAPGRPRRAAGSSE